jgi:EAL domain-containing protein (putative c-di-GMP-specific phosphodiesterase class I)/DNA-binding CsgD family transcriptional regulator
LLCAADALLHWRHPRRGALTARTFLPYAEACGLGTRVGLHLLNLACAQLHAWQEEDPDDVPRMALAVGATQFHDGFLMSIARALDRHGITGQRLEVEIAAGTVTADLTYAATTLKPLAGMGIKVVVSDVDQGTSAVLARLPIAGIRVDAGSVGGQAPGSASALNLGRVVASARRAGLEITACGVREQAELDQLAEMGCDRYAGPLCGAPVAADGLRHACLHHLAARPHGDGAANELDLERVLTSRQLEVLRLLAHGMNTKQMAASLSVSIKTVEAHRAAIMSRTRLHTVAALVRLAVRKGLIAP